MEQLFALITFIGLGSFIISGICLANENRSDLVNTILLGTMITSILSFITGVIGTIVYHFMLK